MKETAISSVLRPNFPIDASQHIMRCRLPKALPSSGCHSYTVAMHDTCAQEHPTLACADRYLDQPAFETWQPRPTESIRRDLRVLTGPDGRESNQLLCLKGGQVAKEIKGGFAEAAARQSVR